MPWSGGTYTKGNAGTGGWTGDAGLGIGIEAGRHDTQDNDFATGINNCLTKDGQNTPTANLSMGGYKHTGVGNATAADEYLSYGQLLDVTKAVTTSGTEPNYTVTLTPAPSAYATGQTFDIRIHSTLTSSAGATLNVNGLGAKALKVKVGASTNRDILEYELNIRGFYRVSYDATDDCFIVQNPTFGSHFISYTPSVSSDAGSVSLTGTQDTWYQYLSGSVIKVHITSYVNLSGATSAGLSLSLPVTGDPEEDLTVGGGFVSGVSGYSSYGGEAFIQSNNIRWLRTDQANFPIDPEIRLYASMIYTVNI